MIGAESPTPSGGAVPLLAPGASRERMKLTLVDGPWPGEGARNENGFQNLEDV